MNTPKILLLLTGISAVSAFSQFNERITKQIALRQEIKNCIEGFSSFTAGEKLVYPRLRVDAANAIVARANSGESFITWKTGKIPNEYKEKNVTFFILAGIFAQEAGYNFNVFVNDIHRFKVTTTEADNWRLKGADGSEMIFHSIMRDQFNDNFGYLRLSLPLSWKKQGEEFEIKIIGEKQNTGAWFMVYTANNALEYFIKQSEKESYYNIIFNPDNNTGSFSYYGLELPEETNVKFIYDNRIEKSYKLKKEKNEATLHFELSSGELANLPLRINYDNKNLINIPSLLSGFEEYLYDSPQLISCKTQKTEDGKRIYEFQSIYSPFISALIKKMGSNDNIIHVISSTHQDIAWMDSPEQCRKDRDEKILTPLLKLLKENPEYKYDMEDMLCLKEYLTSHPDTRDEIYKLTKEERLTWGATYIQPYEDMFSGEALIRQFYFGRKWLKNEFPGCDTRTAWNPDVPGRTLQMPQIMKKSGVDFFIISRHQKGIFKWLSPDGSWVLTSSSGHYANSIEALQSDDFPRAAEHITEMNNEWNIINSNINVKKDVPVYAMSDMSTPHMFKDFFEKWNRLKIKNIDKEALVNPNFPAIKYSTAESFMKKMFVYENTLNSISGERPNVWLYIHGPTHHKAISIKRNADILLPAAETFSTINALLKNDFSTYPQNKLNDAWEALIYPDHGWGGKNGDITDSLFKAKYELAESIGKEVYHASINNIASGIKTSPSKGAPVIIFNNLSWNRTDPVQIKIEFAKGEIKNGIKICDTFGKKASSQILSKSIYEDGSINAIELLLIAENVPSIGYKTYYLSPEHKAEKFNLDKNSIEYKNKYYKISFGNGGIKDIYDIEFDKHILDVKKFLGGELFTMQSIGTDAGEFAEIEQPTMEGFDKLSNYNNNWEMIENGEVRTSFENITQIKNVKIKQIVRLYNSIKRIDFDFSLLNFDGTKYREFRLAFPMGMKSGQVSYEVPFGVVEVGKNEIKGAAGERYTQLVSEVHPRAILNWIGISDESIGITFSSSAAVWDYLDPTDSLDHSPVLQPVLLASRRSCHGLGPWYPQEGDHNYNFSIYTHSPGWKNGYKHAIQSNNPLTALFNPHIIKEASSPEEKSFFNISEENIIISTIKKCDDDNNYIIRLYDAEGRDTNVKVSLLKPSEAIEHTNLIEEEGTPLRISGDSPTLKIGHNSIETFKIISETKVKK